MGNIAKPMKAINVTNVELNFNTTQAKKELKISIGKIRECIENQKVSKNYKF